MPEDKRLSQQPAVTSLADGDFFHVITDDGVGGYDTRRISKPNVKQTLGVQTQPEADDRYLRKTNNLSDVGSAATARTNLGLGTAATHSVPASGNASASQVVKGDDTRLTDPRTPTSHTHPADDITGFAAAVQDVGDALYEPLGGGGGTIYSGPGAYHFLPFHPNSLGTVAQSANAIKAFRFYLPHGLTVVKVTVSIGTASAGGSCAVAVYSADGSTLHLDSGTFSTASTGVQTNTLGSPVTLPAGFYWLAWTQDNGTSRFNGTGWNNITIGGLYNAGGVFQVGEAGNTSTGAVFPPTLGGVNTTGSTTPIPVVKLQG